MLDEIRPEPWQTDTCIGNWHYRRRIYEEDGYKRQADGPACSADVVSKNGNLLLNIPVRGDGTIDEKEARSLTISQPGREPNGEAIFGTRPWRKFGEGPTRPPNGHAEREDAKPFTAQDIRIHERRALYAIFLERPERETAIRSLGTRHLPQAAIENVELLGSRRSNSGGMPMRCD